MTKGRIFREKHGPMPLVPACFAPVVRMVTPLVAGASPMSGARA